MFRLSGAYESDGAAFFAKTVLNVGTVLLFSTGLFLILNAHDNALKNQLKQTAAVVEKNQTEGFDDLIVKGSTSLQGLLAEQDVEVGGDLEVAGSGTFASDLTVDGEGTFAAGLTVSGDLKAADIQAENLATSGSLDVGGDLNVEGASTLAKTLLVQGATELGDSLDVAGKTKLQSNLDVGGDVTLNSNLSVVGYTTIGNSLDVVGSAHFSGGLDIVSTSSIGGSLAVQGAATFASDVDVVGKFTAANSVSVTGATSIDGSALPVGTNALTVQGSVGIDGSALGSNGLLALDVFGATKFNNGLTVNGLAAVEELTVAHVTLLNDALSVDGITTLQSTLTVVGAATLQDDLTVAHVAALAGNLTVAGDTALQATLNVSGAAALAGDLDVAGAAHLYGTLTVNNGASDPLLQPDTSFGGTLSVSGATTLGGTLSVDGATNISDTLSVAGATDTGDIHVSKLVLGSATSGNLVVDGYITANDYIIAQQDIQANNNIRATNVISTENKFAVKTAGVYIDGVTTMITNNSGGTFTPPSHATDNFCDQATEHIRIQEVRGGIITSAVCGNNNVGADKYDLAENFPSTQVLAAGDVVAIDTSREDHVVKSDGINSGLVIGVVSTAPGYTLGANGPGYPIALSGRVPVKATSEGGAISAGDYLTSATTPGYAKKAAAGDKTIGQALADFSGTSGTVSMFVRVSNGYDTETLQQTGTIQQGGAANLSSLNVSGTAVIADLQVTGTATVATLVVNGHIVGNDDTRGTVTVAKNTTTAHHAFTTPYAKKPVVVASPSGMPVLYSVSTSLTGFDITVTGPVPNDLAFNYLVQE